MNKLLAPKFGLWYLGEQNAKDLYIIQDDDEEQKNGDHFFEVDLFKVDHSYQFGQFNGMSLNCAKDWVEKHKFNGTEEEYERIAQYNYMLRQIKELIEENARLELQIVGMEKRIRILDALEQYGVDNWDGYTEAMRSLES